MKVADAFFLFVHTFLGPLIVTAGAVVSTVKSRQATSVVWAVSVALTMKVWSLSESLEVVHGDVQEAKDAPSIRQRKSESESKEAKEKVGVGSLVAAPETGPAVIETSAGPATVQVREATAVFWTASVALTWNVCEPSATPV